MPQALYPRLLGDSWCELASSVRSTHLNADELSLRGTGLFRVRHGTNLFVRVLARMLRMPPATGAAKVRLVITPLGHGERWVRRFDDHTLVSTQHEAREGGLIERFGALELRFMLEVWEGALLYRQAGARLRSGLLHLPLSRWMAPRVEAREEADGPNRTHVQVDVSLPGLGRLISYEGCIPRLEGRR